MDRRTAAAPSALLSLLWAAVPALAQAPAEPPPPVFGEVVEVRVVNLEVTVTDKDGVPVTGLSAADFRLTVDSQPLPIGYFTEVRGGDAVEAGAAGEGAGVAGVPDLVPGSPVGTSYLVFIDDFFAIARDRDRVIRSLVDQLGQLGPEDRMAVVAFDGNRLDMISTWSSSAPELERALRKAISRPAYGLVRQAERREWASDRPAPGNITVVRGSTVDTRLDITERHFARMIEQQVGNVVSGAAAALRGFANPPGRKVMILLSGGWPYDPADYVAARFGRAIFEPGLRRGEPLFAPLVDTANQLGYSVYAVDVPGLVDRSLSDVELAAPPNLEESANGFLRETNTQWSLQHVARQTGGRALLDAARLDAMARAAADTRSYYWLGFTPTWRGNDSRHRVAVEVLPAGLKLRSRSGFVDMSRQSEVGMAVESVLLFGGGPNVRPLPVQFGRPERVSMSVMRVPLQLALPLDGLTLVPLDGGVATDLELRIAALDERGGRSEIPVVPVRLKFPAAPGPGKFARYDTQVELRRVTNHLVVAVYDPVSGAIYSANAEVHP